VITWGSTGQSNGKLVSNPLCPTGFWGAAFNDNTIPQDGSTQLTLTVTGMGAGGPTSAQKTFFVSGTLPGGPLFMPHGHAEHAAAGGERKQVVINIYL
jgi:hypothetical protein